MKIDRTEMNTLIRNLESSNPETQELAAVQLGIFGKGNKILVENTLLKALDNSTDEYVKRAIICALGKIQSQQAIPYLEKILKNDNFDVRLVAVEALEEIASPDSIPALFSHYEKENERQIQESIIRTLNKFKREEILLALDKAANLERKQTTNQFINLTKWLETKIPDPGWQPREYFFPNSRFNKLAYRSVIDLILYSKQIDLQTSNSSVILTVLVEKQEEKIMQITFLIEPLNEKYLPPNLKMIILDSENNSVMQATTRSIYNSPNMKFVVQAEQKDDFSFQLIENNFSYQDNFVV